MIGAGPGGLIAARWLLSQGFEPTIFEQEPTLGGQWTALDGRSGVWPSMHTNSSRTLTAFSDLEHETDLVYPSNRRHPRLLEPLCRDIRPYLAHPIRHPRRPHHAGRHGWLVRHAGADERFDRVVVASGRFHSPAIPAVPGLDTFAGSAGAISSYHYRGPGPYRGKRVLVAGCAISALEIASELALLGAARVVLTQRRQRYVLPKFVAGVPSDHRFYTRYGALASETLPAAEMERQLTQAVLEAAGSPEQYGAPAPDPSLFAAGVTLNQQYLPLVAEGRITVRPWMKSVADATVTFSDGRAEEFDGIVLGTGFDISMPFLSADIRTILDLDAVHLDADRYTFHPDLPGLAFVGMWDQAGGYFVPLELQARWIAYTWGGTIPPPSENDQRLAIDAYRSRRGMSQKTQMHLGSSDFRAGRRG